MSARTLSKIQPGGIQMDPSFTIRVPAMLHSSLQDDAGSVERAEFRDEGVDLRDLLRGQGGRIHDDVVDPTLQEMGANGRYELLQPEPSRRNGTHAVVDFAPSVDPVS